MLVISVCLGVIYVLCTLVVVMLSDSSLVLKALISVAGIKPLLSCLLPGLLPSLLSMHSVIDMCAKTPLGNWQRCVIDACHS